jgi:hypothetical protein
VADQLVWEANDPGALRSRLSSLGLGPLAIAIAPAGRWGDRLVAPFGPGGRPPPWLGSGPILAIGWATVDIDRASGAWGDGFAEAAPDDLLGAFARVRDPLVLLEPSTEGPIAASLVRHGEGPAALYLAAPAGDLDAAAARAIARGARFSRHADGPLGPSILLLGGPPWGPHVLLVGSATIERR